MKNANPQENLEQLLRDGAAGRRKMLEAITPVYPVGDYPARRHDRRAQATGPGLLPRLAWLIGIGGVTTAGLLGLVTLVSVLVMSDPAQPSSPILAAQPQPDTLGPSVRSLVAGLGHIEAQMGQRMPPSVEMAAAWPTRLSELPGVLNNAELGLQEPISQEFTALRADFQAAADYVRRQWQKEASTPPTGVLDSQDGVSLAG